MPAEPASRDAWTTAFIDELIRLRPDLTHSAKFVAAVAANEWPRAKDTNPELAAQRWNERVRSARP